MKHIDITFDFETCSTAPDAAPMQLAAVAWDRSSTGEHPFLDDPFNVGIDLRTCVVEGFSFDQDTIDFWRRQNATAKRCVTSVDEWPVDTAFQRFFEWVELTKQKHGASTVCLWCQGQDFDFPILKTIAIKFGLKIPVHQHYFRDCRTFVLEAVLGMLGCDTLTDKSGRVTLTQEDVLAKPMRAYDLFDNKVIQTLTDGRSQHDALYDCLRSSLSVWHCMQLMRS